MPMWLQHLLVLAVVAGAAFVVARQAIATLRAGKGGFGSCCAKGCPPAPTSQHPSQPRLNESPDGRPQRVVFIPSESLTRGRGK